MVNFIWVPKFIKQPNLLKLNFQEVSQQEFWLRGWCSSGPNPNCWPEINPEISIDWWKGKSGRGGGWGVSEGRELRGWSGIYGKVEDCWPHGPPRHVTNFPGPSPSQTTWWLSLRQPRQVHPNVLSFGLRQSQGLGKKIKGSQTYPKVSIKQFIFLIVEFATSNYPQPSFLNILITKYYECVLSETLW
jgi:hypothetical protein